MHTAFRSLLPLTLATLVTFPGIVRAQTPSSAPTTITATGGSQVATQKLPEGELRFGLRVPLKPNAENILTLTARDDSGQTATVNDIRVTQLTLDQIVQAQVTARRLTTTEVKALVADGTIDINDPQNFNVSVFDIVLTIGD